MTTACQCARYLLDRTGPLVWRRVHWLLTYSQIASVRLWDTPLFADPIEAWAYGPVIPAVFAAHRGDYACGASHFETLQVDLEWSPAQRAVLDGAVPCGIISHGMAPAVERVWERVRKRQRQAEILGRPVITIDDLAGA